MGTYAEIQAEVLAYVIDTPSAVQTYVPSYINKALRKIQTKHMFKFMEAEQEYTTVVGSRIIGPGLRPLDWHKPRGKPYWVDSVGQIHKMAWGSNKRELIAATGDNPEFDYGSPRWLFEDELPQEFNVYPYPDGLSDDESGEYTITIPYWKFLPNLISPSDTNWLTDNAHDYVVYQATANAYYANVDGETAGQWETRAMRERADAIQLDKDRRLAETQELIPHIGARGPLIAE